MFQQHLKKRNAKKDRLITSSPAWRCVIPPIKTLRGWRSDLGCSFVSPSSILESALLVPGEDLGEEVGIVDSVGEGVGRLFDADPVSESESAPSNSTEDGGARLLGFWESFMSLVGSWHQLRTHCIHHPTVWITFQKLKLNKVPKTLCVWVQHIWNTVSHHANLLGHWATRKWSSKLILTGLRARLKRFVL